MADADGGGGNGAPPASVSVPTSGSEPPGADAGTGAGGAGAEGNASEPDSPGGGATAQGGAESGGAAGAGTAGSTTSTGGGDPGFVPAERCSATALNPSAFCSGLDSCPVTMATAVECADAAQLRVPDVAAVAAGGGYLLLNPSWPKADGFLASYPVLVSLSAGAVEMEDFVAAESAFGARFAFSTLHTDLDGNPFLAGSVIQNEASTVSLFWRDGSEWRRDVITTETESASPHTRMAPDGRVFVLLESGGTSSRVLALSTRAPDGGWTREVLTEAHNSGSGLALALDEAGSPHTAYWAETDVPAALLERDSAGSELVVKDDATLLSRFDLAVLGSGATVRSVIAYGQPGGTGSIELLFTDAAGTVSLPVPEALEEAANTCGDACDIDCSESGWAFGLPRLVRTADGTLWLVYTTIEYDVDVRLQTVIPFDFPTCERTVLEDRSVPTLHLQRVPPDGVGPLEASVRLVLPQVPDAVTPVVDASGSTIVVAVGIDPVTYVELDADAVP